MTNPRIYIMGPYTGGDVAQNVRRAIEAADVVVDLGGTPYIPHLSHFWHLIKPHKYEFWMEQDIQWLEVCDAAYRLPGESKGADREYTRCGELKIPVFVISLDLMNFIDGWRNTHGYYHT